MNLTYKIFGPFVTSVRNNSLISKLRQHREKRFQHLIRSQPRPLKILDIGGTEVYWESLGYSHDSDYEIILVNIYQIPVKSPNIKSMIGDGRSLQDLKDQEFDVAFSNSVIEHVGGFADQKRMAKEMKRIGKRYFLQTPNYYFPIEPHFLFPFFQFLPMKIKVLLIQHFSLGWMGQQKNVADATAVANSIRLLKRKELELLFPDSTILEEKIMGLTYSFLVYSGFDE